MSELNGQPRYPIVSPTVFWGYEGYAMAYDAGRGEIVLFGGLRWTNSGASSNYVNETWLWNGVTWRQANPTQSPDGRTGHSMAYDAANGKVVLFGGQDNDTWIWDGANWTRISTPNGPVARQMHTMAYDLVRRQVILFGGQSILPNSTTPGHGMEVSGHTFRSQVARRLRATTLWRTTPPARK